MRPEPFAIERFFARFEFSARHLLSSSDCEPLTLAELLAMADPEVRAMWERLSLAYTESAGLPVLREEIARTYEGVETDDVLTVVPEEGILLAMWAALEPGDHVVVTWPAYQSLHSIARSIGCEISRWEPRPGRGFVPDDLFSLLRPSTRLVVMNFPHNPTGHLPSRADYAGAVEAVEEAGALVFSDEMYRGLEHDAADRLPSAVELSPRAVTLSGLSKSCSLPGLRTGWLVCRDRSLLERIASLKDYTTICASAPSEVLAVAGVRNRERIVSRNRDIIAGNLAAIERFIAESDGAFSWDRPRAGSVGLVRWDVASGTEAACERLSADGVMLLPSKVFDYGDAHVRFGYGRAGFAAGLAELTERVRTDVSMRRRG